MNRQITLSTVFNKWLYFLGTMLIVILTVIPCTFSQTVYPNLTTVDLLSAKYLIIISDMISWMLVKGELWIENTCPSKYYY